MSKSLATSTESKKKKTSKSGGSESADRSPEKETPCASSNSPDSRCQNFIWTGSLTIATYHKRKCSYCEQSRCVPYSVDGNVRLFIHTLLLKGGSRLTRELLPLHEATQRRPAWFIWRRRNARPWLLKKACAKCQEWRSARRLRHANGPRALKVNRKSPHTDYWWHPFLASLLLLHLNTTHGLRYWPSPSLFSSFEFLFYLMCGRMLI